MSVSGVVCEFNPFHNGHEYLLRQMKKDDSDIVCIMSGNFVQRGDFAVCDKYLRAENAVKCGADLVIELPLPYALGSAETFARGAISILNSLGFVDRLYFGSESSLDKLKNVLELTKTSAFKNDMEINMKKGMSYPDAFFSASGENSLAGGNDILALEYLRRLDILQSSIEPCAVGRVGNGHNSDNVCGKYASASYIRNILRQGGNAGELMPFNVEKGDVSIPEKLELAVFSVLRQMSEKDFSLIADINEGLEYRLRKSVTEAESLADLFEKVRTKRYTLSKLRRIFICSYLGVTKEMQEYIPCFVNVLSCSRRGTRLLSLMKERSEILPVIRYSDTQALSETDKAFYDFTAKCDDIFGLTLPIPRKAGYDMRRKFNVVKQER